uniref:Uncharacterized protein n=1 Tax=Arundo donax TaxID=35708 RepID=A0A0A9FSP4_ARUDO
MYQQKLMVHLIAHEKLTSKNCQKHFQREQMMRHLKRFAKMLRLLLSHIQIDCLISNHHC